MCLQCKIWSLFFADFSDSGPSEDHQFYSGYRTGRCKVLTFLLNFIPEIGEKTGQPLHCYFCMPHVSDMVVAHTMILGVQDSNIKLITNPLLFPNKAWHGTCVMPIQEETLAFLNCERV